jgi:hypothetical protein
MLQVCISKIHGNVVSGFSGFTGGLLKLLIGGLNGLIFFSSEIIKQWITWFIKQIKVEDVVRGYQKAFLQYLYPHQCQASEYLAQCQLFRNFDAVSELRPTTSKTKPMEHLFFDRQKERPLFHCPLFLC